MGNPYFIVDNNLILRPFGLHINLNESLIPRLPPVNEETEQIPGRDGDLLTQLTYGPRTFEFVLYTNEGLDRADLLRLEDRIKAGINKARASPKGVELLFMRDRRTYFVSPTSNPFEITKDYPTWFECTISLKAHDPYGYEAYEKKFRGTIDINNVGNETAETTLIIDGPNVNPSLTAGPTTITAGKLQPAERYWYDGTIKLGEILVIDSESQTAYIQSNGVEINVTGKWCGNFLRLPVGITRVSAGFNVHLRYYNKWI